MKKMRRMLSTLVVAAMLMNVPVTVWAEDAAEAPAAPAEQVQVVEEAPKAAEPAQEAPKAEEPAAEAPDVFYDVPEEAWYANAIGWANASGVLQGVSPHYFRPDVALSRQQAAVALYRFAAYAGLNTKLPADAESSFPDADDYAQDALRWCAASGIPCHGQTALTAPVSRADWAVMLSAFCKLLPN